VAGKFLEGGSLSPIIEVINYESSGWSAYYGDHAAMKEINIGTKV
jgi:hypothetical protein